MNRVKIGTVINVRGLKGEMKIASSTSFASLRYKKGNKLYLVNYETHQEVEVVVVKHSTVSIFDYAIFEGIDTIEKANLYRGYVVEANIEDLHKLKDGSYYFYELEGCKVYDTADNLIGEVTEVLDNTAQEIIRVNTGTKSVLIPFIKVFINSVNIEEKKIVINVMEGLL